MQTIYFEDQGQDFLEWDVDANGVVVGCRPFQADIWCGAVVENICEGLRPTVTHPLIGVPQGLNYAVVRVREMSPNE